MTNVTILGDLVKETFFKGRISKSIMAISAFIYYLFHHAESIQQIYLIYNNIYVMIFHQAQSALKTLTIKLE